MSGNQGAGPRYLFFSHGGQCFAVESRFVDEVVLPVDVVPAPRAPSFIEGVVNLRGRIVTLLSARHLLRLGVCGKRTATLVFRMPGMDLGMDVEEVLEIRSISAGSLGDAPLEEDLKETPIKAVLPYEGRPVGFLDMERLRVMLMEHDYKKDHLARKPGGVEEGA